MDVCAKLKKKPPSGEMLRSQEQDKWNGASADSRIRNKTFLSDKLTVLQFRPFEIKL